jgi:hypothetical protein
MRIREPAIRWLLRDMLEVVLQEPACELERLPAHGRLRRGRGPLDAVRGGVEEKDVLLVDGLPIALPLRPDDAAAAADGEWFGVRLQALGP